MAKKKEVEEIVEITTEELQEMFADSNDCFGKWFDSKTAECVACNIATECKKFMKGESVMAKKKGKKQEIVEEEIEDVEVDEIEEDTMTDVYEDDDDLDIEELEDDDIEDLDEEIEEVAPAKKKSSKKDKPVKEQKPAPAKKKRGKKAKPVDDDDEIIDMEAEEAELIKIPAGKKAKGKAAVEVEIAVSKKKKEKKVTVEDDIIEEVEKKPAKVKDDKPVKKEKSGKSGRQNNRDENGFQVGSKVAMVASMIKAGKYTLPQIIAAVDKEFGDKNLGAVKHVITKLTTKDGHCSSRGWDIQAKKGSGIIYIKN